MGVCDSTTPSNKTAEGKVSSKNPNKYFVEKPTLNSQNSLFLTNDVIVSDTNQNPELTYEKIKRLGEGSFGDVWLVRHKLLGKDYAMKIIEKSPYSNIRQIINEINILKTLDHPNILKILEFHLENDKFYIITDYCPEGELFNEIATKKIFSEKETSYIIYQVLQAVRYCHKMRIIHRDIKPENIMILGRESNGLLNIKLIDFGTAKIFDVGNKQKALVGSSYYIAPEVIHGKYDEACDLWSVGVIMYLMLVGIPPFNGKDEDDILRAVDAGSYDVTCPEFTSLSPNAKDLIVKLLTYNPTDRITAEQALAHPWFQTNEFKALYRSNTINPNEAKIMMSNLEFYKSNNIIKCAVLAYLVHQNINSKECLNASRLFIEIDLNKDGKLEKNEIESALAKYSGLTPEQSAKRATSIFLNIDTDNNGYIESEEFIRACINPNIFCNKNCLLAAFNYFDGDKDGIISITEVEAKFLQTSKNQNEATKRELKRMFDQIDLNKDGIISFDEFSAMIKGAIVS